MIGLAEIKQRLDKAASLEGLGILSCLLQGIVMYDFQVLLEISKAKVKYTSGMISISLTARLKS